MGNIIANVQCLILALRHAIKQSCHWSIAWSMKLCWLLTTYQPHAASAHWGPSLASDKHVPACLFKSVSPTLHALVHWCGFHAARRESEWSILLWCLAAQRVAVKLLETFWFSAHHACVRALGCCDTRLRTAHKTWPPNRPDLSSVDYRLLRVIQECVCQKQQGTSNIVDELWLLTEWYFIKKNDILYFTR